MYHMYLSEAVAALMTWRQLDNSVVFATPLVFKSHWVVVERTGEMPLNFGRVVGYCG